jgi:hypothetical protein
LIEKFAFMCINAVAIFVFKSCAMFDGEEAATKKYEQKKKFCVGDTFSYDVYDGGIRLNSRQA